MSACIKTGTHLHPTRRSDARLNLLQKRCNLSAKTTTSQYTPRWLWPHSECFPAFIILWFHSMWAPYFMKSREQELTNRIVYQTERLGSLSVFLKFLHSLMTCYCLSKVWLLTFCRSTPSFKANKTLFSIYCSRCLSPVIYVKTFIFVSTKATCSCKYFTLQLNIWSGKCRTGETLQLSYTESTIQWTTYDI